MKIAQSRSLEYQPYTGALPGKALVGVLRLKECETLADRMAPPENRPEVCGRFIPHPRRPLCLDTGALGPVSWNSRCLFEICPRARRVRRARPVRLTHRMGWWRPPPEERGLLEDVKDLVFAGLEESVPLCLLLNERKHRELHVYTRSVTEHPLRVHL